MAIRFTTSEQGIQYVTNFIMQMEDYVNFNKNPIVSEDAILQHAKHTLNEIDSDQLVLFKNNLKASVEASKQVNKKFNAKYLKEVWDVNSPADWKRAIEAAPASHKPSLIEIGKFFLSSKVYLKLLGIGALACVAAVSGLFSKQPETRIPQA